MPPHATSNHGLGPAARTAIQLRPSTTGQTGPSPRNPHHVAAVAGWVALVAMAVTQVASSQAGHLEILVTLIVAALAVASVSFTGVS